MNDTPDKKKPALASVKDKPAPGHVDVLGSPVDAPRRICVMKWEDTLKAALDHARDLGYWFATGTHEGAKSPDTVEKELNQGRKLWEIFGVPPGFNPQTMMAGGDIFQVELIDPIRAAQQLQARADGAREASDRILAELKSEKH